MLVLAVLWWAWVGYAWLTSVIDPEEGAVRIALFAAMAGLLVVALCVPEAFGDRALGFAIAYGVVRAGHIALFCSRAATTLPAAFGARPRGQRRRSPSGCSSPRRFLDGVAQAGLWVARSRPRLRAGRRVFGITGWRLVPGHFAERHNLVIILALGESIVALGVGAQADLTAGVITAAVLGVALASALWWTYFDVVALVTKLRLERAPEGAVRNALARDSYSYLHFPMVAGIILVAFGLEYTLAHVDDPLDDVHRFALLGGTAIYLLAHVALRLRNAAHDQRAAACAGAPAARILPVRPRGFVAGGARRRQRSFLGGDRLREHADLRRAPLRAPAWASRRAAVSLRRSASCSRRRVAWTRPVAPWGASGRAGRGPRAGTSARRSHGCGHSAPRGRAARSDWSSRTSVLSLRTSSSNSFSGV